MSAAPRVSACAHASSLPAAFFDNARRTSTDDDRRVHSQRCLLARALLLASQHRWVADWLFSDPHARFHANLPVPLSAFDNAHPLSIMHLFEGEGYSRRLASSMLVVPIATMNSICVGYTVSQGSNEQRNVGRCAFHSGSREMLLVVNYYSPTITAVMSVIPHAHTVKQFLFTCPAEQYSFSNLPNQVHTLHVGEREPVATTAVSQAAPQSQPLPNSIDHFLSLWPQNDCALPSSEQPSSSLPLVDFDFDAPSQLPWIIDDTCTLSDNVGIPANPGIAETSSGAFNLTALSTAIRHIESTLQGRFLGCAESNFPLAATQGAPIEQTVVSINTAEPLEAKLLRRYAVNVYFDATIAAVSDEKLLSLAPACARAEDAPRARRIAPSATSATGVTADVGGAKADAAHERMLEARRRRNRLSAARSNERRKENWRRNVQMLGELKRRVEELRSRQERLLEENGVLRTQVGRGGAAIQR